jgi:hypothetical protein
MTLVAKQSSLTGYDFLTGFAFGEMDTSDIELAAEGIFKSKLPFAFK